MGFLSLERKAVLKKTSTLEVRPSSVFDHTSDDLKGKLKAKTDVYYLPTDPTQEGIDSFIIHDSILYLFQFTNAKKHDTKDFAGPSINLLGIWYKSTGG